MFQRGVPVMIDCDGPAAMNPRVLEAIMRRILLCFILAAVCGRRAAGSQSPSDSAAPVRLAWYSALPETVASTLATEFAKRHPGIRVDLERASLLFEPRGETGAHWARMDVVTDVGLGAHSKLFAEGAFARLVVPAPQTRRAGDRSPSQCPWVMDPRGRYAFTHAVQVPILFQRGSVAEEDAPDTLAALAEPRWKGKTVLLAPSGEPYADCLYRLIAAQPGLGFGWLERMRDNDVMLLESSGAVWEAVISGVRPVGWGIALPPQDASGTRTPSDSSVFLLYATAIGRRAPHPEAARLFVSWLIDMATCRQLEQKTVCGGPPQGLPSDGEFTRKVWKALLPEGDGHIPR